MDRKKQQSLRSHGKPGQAGRQIRLKVDDFARKINKVIASQDDDSVGETPKQVSAYGDRSPVEVLAHEDTRWHSAREGLWSNVQTAC